MNIKGPISSLKTADGVSILEVLTPVYAIYETSVVESDESIKILLASDRNWAAKTKPANQLWSVAVAGKWAGVTIGFDFEKCYQSKANAYAELERIVIARKLSESESEKQE